VLRPREDLLKVDPGGNQFLYSVTEPVLGPVRRILPPVRMGAVGLDLSPFIVLVGLQILAGLI